LALSLVTVGVSNPGIIFTLEDTHLFIELIMAILRNGNLAIGFSRSLGA